VLGLYRPIVFVVDHPDIFFRDGQAGLRIAYFVSELRRLVPRSLTVVCVNQDLWEATFRSQLPSALEDRLTGGFLQLDGLNPVQATELVGQRARAAGLDSANAGALVEFLRIGDLFALNAGRPVSPRALLRYSAGRWEAFFQTHPQPPAPEVAAAEAAATVSPRGAESRETQSGPDPSSFAEPIAPSVVGAETLDTIAQAIDAIVDETPGTPVPAPPAASPSRTVFHELQERLETLRQPVRPNGSPTTTFDGSSQNDLASVAFAENFRRHANAPLSPGLDWQRFAELLRFAGGQSPAIRVAELEVPGVSGAAIQWLSPDAEILFGLEPATRPAFWTALTAHATQRAKDNGGLPVKVVVFGETAAGSHPAAAEWPPEGAGITLDLVEISASDLAAIMAASELIGQYQSGAVPTSSSEVAAVVARELDSIWRRVTRLPAAAR
jgi:hypothetical protein